MENIFKHLILPSNLILVLLSAGLLLLFVKRRAGVFLLALSVVTYLFFSAGPVSYFLLGNLEYRYPPLDHSGIAGVKKIVLLTGDGERDMRIPLSSRINSSSAFRVLEAARIFRKADGADIIITGFEDVPALMKEVLVSIDVPEDRVFVEDRSMNTFESARNVRPMVGENAFILVTSAGHMPRSAMAFSKLGMSFVPAPTDYFTHKNFLEVNYRPSPIHLRYSDLAVHEYAAIIWYRLTGRG